MKTNELVERVKNEIEEFNFEFLGRLILEGGHQYNMVINDDGSLFWNVDAAKKGIRVGKNQIYIRCPYYSKPVTSKEELKSLTTKLKKMVYDRIMSVPI